MNINLNGDSKYPINHKHFFKIMRTTLILLFCGIMFSQASNSYSQVFNFNLKSTFIKDVFNEIEENSDYIFVFTDKSEKIIDKKVDLNANSEDVKEILDNVLSTTGLTYRIIDKQIVIYESNESNALTNDIKSETAIQQQNGKLIKIGRASCRERV